MKMPLAQDKFFKSQDLWAAAYEDSIDQSRQMEWSQFSKKIVGVNFSNFIFNNSIWHKVNEGIVKNTYLEQSETLFES